MGCIKANGSGLLFLISTGFVVSFCLFVCLLFFYLRHLVRLRFYFLHFTWRPLVILSWKRDDTVGIYIMFLRPVQLGFLLSIIGLCLGDTEINKKETNQVYSYTYHFQHNGTTDPKQFIQSLLADTPDGGNVVKTFSNNNIRGFVSKGFLPSGPIAGTSFRRRNPELEGIKNLVDKNFKELEKPISPISVNQVIPNRFPDVNLEVNNRINSINDRLRNTDRFSVVPNRNDNDLSHLNKIADTPVQIPPHNNHLVTRVQEFEKDIPNGKVYEKIETYSFNPPPTANVITHTERIDGGIHQRQEVNHQNRQGFGHRTVSYFKKEFNNGLPLFNSIENQPPTEHLRRHSGNQNAKPDRTFRNGNNPPNVPAINSGHNRVYETQFNNNFGSRITRPQYNNITPHERNFINFNERRNNQHQNGRIPAPQNNEFNAPNVLKEISPNDNTAEKVNSIFNDVNNRLNEVHHRFNNVNNKAGFSWDDDNRDWQRLVQDNNREWQKNVRNNNNNWYNVLPPSITNKFTVDNRRTFSNGHSGSPPTNNQPIVVNSLGPQAVDALRSTLEALVGARLDIPSFPLNQGNDNSRNLNGGGIERVVHVDRVIEGPNSFSRDQHRGYERNFNVNSNTGYHRSNQWSTNTFRRLDTQSSSDEFSKDFIDVFNDGI